MKKFLLPCIFLLSLLLQAQPKQPWRSFFSYTDIVDVAQTNSRVYGAATSAIFSKSDVTNEIKTVTSVDGLKAETITALYHSTFYNKTFVGNANGLLLIVNADNTVITKKDIVQEAAVAAAKKKINHIGEHDGLIYISCDFGITVFDPSAMEFGDTYYLGPGGSEVAVAQTAVHNGFIIAACPGSGLYRGLLSNPNLNDFNQWENYAPGQWVGVVSFEGNLMAADTTGRIYRAEGTPAIFFTMPSGARKITGANGYLVITSPGYVIVFNDDLLFAGQVPSIPGETTPTIFTCATVVTNKLYIGTQGKGMFAAPLGSMVFENITPDGPQRDNVFAIKKPGNFLWAVYGDYTYFYNPHSPTLDYYGASKLTATGWINIPNNEMFNAACLADIAINPNNQKQVFASSFHSGLVAIEDDVPVMLYNDTNSDGALQSLGADPGYKSIRVNSPVFDKNGNLWMSNSRITRPIVMYKPGSGDWVSFSVENVVEEPERVDYGRMAIDKNGTKWLPTQYSGLVGFNEALGEKFIVIGQRDGLPSDHARCVAADNNGRLWIGNDKGLRILPSVDRFTTESTLTINPVIIMEDGLAQELMYEQSLLDIVVDGSNNKWIATAGAGAFLVSPDGQQTLFHFTRENSPLPSNTINDIEIDSATGEVFFATDKGLVSYQGTSTAAEDDLNNVYVFPNPVRPEFNGDVNISGLMDEVNVKITDIEGNLVYETTSEGGTVLWDTTAFGKYKVASGVYMIFISSEDGTKTKVKKVMIVR